MSSPHFDVIVIGGGQAGLGASYFLTQHGLRHVVLERGRIGESWRSQRWHSFRLNTPNRFNVLPGDLASSADPDRFDSANGFVGYLEGYADRFRLPVQNQTRVVALEPQPSGYSVTALRRGSMEAYTCSQVIVASGGMSETKRPSLSNDVSPTIRQCHAGEYRSSGELPDGAVLVVGSAQSGLQVAEDLIEGGRKVYLSTSAVGRVPRRYRGRDIFSWLMDLGFFDVMTRDVASPKELEMRQPQVSGVGPLGHSLSIQALAQRGAVILGKVETVRGTALDVQPNAAHHIKFGDEVSSNIKGMVDQYIAAHHLDCPPPDSDPADQPDDTAVSASNERSLDLEKAGVRSIVWATGFGADFRYLPRGVLDERKRPVHHDGLTGLAGLYFLGLPWLRKRKSGIIPGIAEDAAFIAEKVHSMSKARRTFQTGTSH